MIYFCLCSDWGQPRGGERMVTCMAVAVTALMPTAPPTHGRNVLVVEEAQAATSRPLRDNSFCRHHGCLERGLLNRVDDKIKRWWRSNSTIRQHYYCTIRRDEQMVNSMHVLALLLASCNTKTTPRSKFDLANPRCAFLFCSTGSGQHVA